MHLTQSQISLERKKQTSFCSGLDSVRNGLGPGNGETCWVPKIGDHCLWPLVLLLPVLPPANATLLLWNRLVQSQHHLGASSAFSTTWGHGCVAYQAPDTEHLQVILVQPGSPEALVCPLSEEPNRNQWQQSDHPCWRGGFRLKHVEWLGRRTLSQGWFFDMIKYLGHRTWVPKCSSYSVYRGQLSLLSQWTPNWQLSPMYSTSVGCGLLCCYTCRNLRQVGISWVSWVCFFLHQT